MREPDDLEKAVWDRLEEGWPPLGDKRRDALAQVERALTLREASQGPEHSDLIWPLSLKIELLRIHHAPDASLEAAQVGERRLALQRLALRDAPSELLRSLRELAELYVFEYELLDPARVKALEAEIERLEAVLGGRPHGR